MARSRSSGAQPAIRPRSDRPAADRRQIRRRWRACRGSPPCRRDRELRPLRSASVLRRRTPAARPSASAAGRNVRNTRRSGVRAYGAPTSTAADFGNVTVRALAQPGALGDRVRRAGFAIDRGRFDELVDAFDLCVDANVVLELDRTSTCSAPIAAISVCAAASHSAQPADPPSRSRGPATTPHEHHECRVNRAIHVTSGRGR